MQTLVHWIRKSFLGAVMVGFAAIFAKSVEWATKELVGSAVQDWLAGKLGDFTGIREAEVIATATILVVPALVFLAGVYGAVLVTKQRMGGHPSSETRRSPKPIVELDYQKFESIGNAIRKIQAETHIENDLFPNRLDLDENSIDFSVLEFIRGLAIREDIYLYETRRSISRLVLINSSTLRHFKFEKGKYGLSIWDEFDLVSEAGVRMTGLYIRKVDINISIDRLRQAAPLWRTLPSPGQS